MSQFRAIRSAKAAYHLEALLRRSKILLQGRTAFDRPDDGGRDRGPGPACSQAFPRRQASKCDLRKSHDARSAARPTRNSRPPVTWTTAITVGRRSARI